MRQPREHQAQGRVAASSGPRELGRPVVACGRRGVGCLGVPAEGGLGRSGSLCGPATMQTPVYAAVMVTAETNPRGEGERVEKAGLRLFV